jgi:GTPase SAR1 family protein
MAGSGKSRLTASFGDWLKLTRQNVIFVNLDPGVISLPYNPDIDARNYVDISALMNEYKLGPNGALLLASDLIADHLEEIREEIDEVGADIVLIDTPGQIELFAFRESGPYIMDSISDCPKATVYLFDAPFCRNPLNYISNVYLSISVYTRLIQPQIYALSKIDLIKKEELNKILSWSKNIDLLQNSLWNEGREISSLINENLIRIISEAGLDVRPIPLSSIEDYGFPELNAELTRLVSKGEEERP